MKHITRVLASMLASLILLVAVTPATAQMGSDAERLQAYIEQTGEILARAADFVADAPNPRSLRILEEARYSHRRSMEHAMAGQGRMAFAHSQRAREGAQQAARIARDLAGNTERFQRRLERYMELRERVEERVRESGNDRAMRFLQESSDQASRAHDLQKQGDVQLGLQVLEGAEDLLARAARIAYEGGGTARLERELERTREFIHRVETEAGDDPAAAELLTSARMALTRAEEAAAQGRVMQALNSAELARRLARQAAAADDTIDQAMVERQIERFDERYERVREMIGDSGSPQAVQALERARVHRERAAELLDQGKLEPALRQIKAGFDLLAAAHESVR